MPVVENKNWPIPITSKQLLEDAEIRKAAEESQKFQLTYRVDGNFVAEVDPEHEKKRKEREAEGKARL